MVEGSCILSWSVTNNHVLHIYTIQIHRRTELTNIPTISLQSTSLSVCHLIDGVSSWVIDFSVCEARMCLPDHCFNISILEHLVSLNIQGAHHIEVLQHPHTIPSIAPVLQHISHMSGKLVTYSCIVEWELVYVSVDDVVIYTGFHAFIQLNILIRKCLKLA